MDKLKIIVASNNEGKIREIKKIFADFEVISLKEITSLLNKEIVVAEDKDTFSENALLKANFIYKELGDKYLCIADDSGLCIDALDGFPGVKTARWLYADDHTKNVKILEKMKTIKDNKRSCKYITAIAVVGKNIKEVFECSLNGYISYECKGENGFGFDEIFKIETGYTLAELSTEEKLKVSPRKKALELLKKYIDNIM